MHVRANKKISCPEFPYTKSTEDPRLFTFQGSAWMCFACSSWPNNNPVSILRYGRLAQVGNEWHIEQVFQPKYGKNDGTGMEKNWIPFEHNGELFFIYRNTPKQIVLKVHKEEILAEYESSSPHWRWGEIRGGTSPLPWKGQLLRFFHSSLDFEQPPARRRYFMGAAVMEAVPPFKTVAVSKSPIVYGSESDTYSLEERAGSVAYKEKVIFPAGVVMQGDEFLVSAGCNDAACLLLKVGEKDLKL